MKTPHLLLPLAVAITSLTLGAGLARADVTLPHLLSDHMVLQRDCAIPVWGWAEPGEEVTVLIGKSEARTTTGATGSWRVDLPAMAAGGPHELTIRGRNTILLSDILIGEVWLCSGQSNMEMGIEVVENGKEEAAAADFPGIRLFEVARNPRGEPQDDVAGQWLVCSPESIVEGDWGGFSAVAYFFGRELHRELEVPIGLIDSCWGGTRIEPWTPPAGFRAVPAVSHFADEIAEKDREYKEDLPGRLEAIERWIEATRDSLANGRRLPDDPWWPRHPTASAESPSGLYNGMIHPLLPFAIKGALWYQGESNVHARDGMAYFEKMKALIGGWRAAWGCGEFPFYFVQIAPFNYDWHAPGIDPLEVPRIWEAQTASLALANTGMIVTTDIANLRDIHPGNKQEVGRRLSLLALRNEYGRGEVVYSGPLFRDVSVESGKMRIQFDHAQGGLKSRDDKPLTWIQIAGEDQQFVDAEAEIDGQTLLVWSDAVENPVAVRFGWNMLAEPNLANAAGLPASPFRSDSW